MNKLSFTFVFYDLTTLISSHCSCCQSRIFSSSVLWSPSWQEVKVTMSSSAIVPDQRLRSVSWPEKKEGQEGEASGLSFSDTQAQKLPVPRTRRPPTKEKMKTLSLFIYLKKYT